MIDIVANWVAILASQDNASIDDSLDKGENFILLIHFDTENGTVQRRARIDTGSPNEFISYKTVQRLHAEGDIVPLNTDDSWVGVQGEEFRARGKLHRSWACVDSSRTWDTDFYVIDTIQFDVLLGRQFIQESNAVLLNRSVLPIYKNKKSAGMPYVTALIWVDAYTACFRGRSQG
jgi:hypothetical protein